MVRLFQDAAGTNPATAPGQVIGLVKRAGGTVDISALTNRPRLVRWPKTGRRNLLSSTEDLSGVFWNKVNITASGLTIMDIADTDMVGRTHALRANHIMDAGTYTLRFRFKSIGPVLSFVLLFLGTGDVVTSVRVITATGETTTLGTGNPSHTTCTPLGDGWFDLVCVAELPLGMRYWDIRMTYSLVPGTTGSMYVASGEGGMHFSHIQLERNISPTPYQIVVNPENVTEAGVPDQWHLENVDTREISTPPMQPGTYGLAYVDYLGNTTVTTIELDGELPVGLLRVARQADVVLRRGAFSAAEETAIREYWKRLYA